MRRTRCVILLLLLNCSISPASIPRLNDKQNSPNVLTGTAVAGASYIDSTGAAPVCLIASQNGPVNQPGAPTMTCEYFPVDADNPFPFVLMSVTCPTGQIALQNGCVSAGFEALTGVVQDLASVSCYVNVADPANPDWSGGISATCVNMELQTASGAKLTSALPKAGRAYRAALRASARN